MQQCQVQLLYGQFFLSSECGSQHAGPGCPGRFGASFAPSALSTGATSTGASASVWAMWVQNLNELQCFILLTLALSTIDGFRAFQQQMRANRMHIPIAVGKADGGITPVYVPLVSAMVCAAPLVVVVLRNFWCSPARSSKSCWKSSKWFV